MIDPPVPRFRRLASLFSRLALVGPALFAGLSLVSAAEPGKSTKPSPDEIGSIRDFLEDRCAGCHDGDGEGGFDLRQIAGSLDDAETLARWVRVIDRVESGEMPPADDGPVPANQRSRFVEGASRYIGAHQRSDFQANGRVRGRRLTPKQIERSLADVLGNDDPVSRLVPDPPRALGYEGLADRDAMSHFQMQSHLQMVDAALDSVRQRLRSRDEYVIDLPAERIANKPPGKRNRSPEMHKGAAVAWNSTMPFYARVPRSQVDRGGYYRIELEASGLNVPKDADDGGPDIWCSIRSGECQSSAPILYPVGIFAVDNQRRTYVFESYIREGHLLEIRPLDKRLKLARFGGGQVGYGEGGPQKVPGLAMHQLRITQIYPQGERDVFVDTVLGDLPVREVEKPRKRKSSSADIAIELEPVDDLRDRLEQQLTNFVRHAFRGRGDSREIVEPYLQYLNAQLDSDLPPIEALFESYRAVLCSPRFQYFIEPPGALDGPAYATRLAFFLTGGPPDASIMRDARTGRLSERDVVIEHIDRLLGLDGKHDPNSTPVQSRDFTRRFAGQWLDLDLIDFTEPDRRMHPTFDPIVQQSMLEETQWFLADALAANRSAAELMDSDHTFVNGRLAAYYEMPGVNRHEMPGNKRHEMPGVNRHDIHRVGVPEGSPRGGLLAQGSVLKVTAAGADTSPIVRGVWISERLLGCEIPPPPASVPEVEPDTRGTKTIRDQLTAHLNDDACASCHRNIDPPGYALEQFDAAGKFRQTYFNRNRKRKPGLSIDVSHQTADGKSFKTFDDFKRIVASEPDSIARNLVAQWIVFGTGMPIQFVDRGEIDAIVDQVDQPYGVRDLLYATLTSNLYRTK